MDAANTRHIERYKKVINATPGWAVAGYQQVGNDYWVGATFSRGALHLHFNIGNIHDWYDAKKQARLFMEKFDSAPATR